jgi:hypothetical protein
MVVLANADPELACAVDLAVGVAEFRLRGTGCHPLEAIQPLIPKRAEAMGPAGDGDRGPVLCTRVRAKGASA